MIKTLQKKFVITAMIAITVLILFLLGAINIVNMIITENEIERTLHIIAETENNAGNPPPRQNDMPPHFFGGMPKNNADTVMSSNFFVVRFDSEGNIMNVDVSRTSTVSEEEAENLALKVYQKEEKTGSMQNYRYMMQDTQNQGFMGTSIIFLDTSGESFSYLRVLLLSGAAGLACWVLMLVLVIVLSRKAIRPIAENIEKQKQFVTNAGHEIKTPIAIIQSNTEAMELYNGENKWSKNIKEQVMRLGGLMERLLTLARMDEGAVSLNKTDVPLTELLEKAIQSFKQSIEQKQISLETDIEPNLQLYADSAQVEQLISILLDNSVKYTECSGQIWISLRRNEKKIKLCIQNTCERLPDVPPDKLFDRFYRADSARTQKNGGYGIGLAIARSAVSANGWELKAKYITPNKIRFTISFK